MCNQSNDKLEHIQRHPTRVIFPHWANDERLTQLKMQALDGFIFYIIVNHLQRIQGDLKESHRVKCSFVAKITKDDQKLS